MVAAIESRDLNDRHRPMAPGKNRMVTLPRAEPVRQNIETGVPADETTAKAKKKQPTYTHCWHECPSASFKSSHLRVRHYTGLSPHDEQTSDQ